jgi:hypothetical protein
MEKSAPFGEKSSDDIMWKPLEHEIQIILYLKELPELFLQCLKVQTYGDASKNYKFIIIQFSVPVLRTISIIVQIPNVLNLAENNLKISHPYQDCNC